MKLLNEGVFKRTRLKISLRETEDSRYPFFSRTLKVGQTKLEAAFSEKYVTNVRKRVSPFKEKLQPVTESKENSNICMYFIGY